MSSDPGNLAIVLPPNLSRQVSFRAYCTMRLQNSRVLSQIVADEPQNSQPFERIALAFKPCVVLQIDVYHCA